MSHRGKKWLKKWESPLIRKGAIEEKDVHADRNKRGMAVMGGRKKW